MAAAPRAYGRAGDQAYAAMDKVNAELLSMTYGAMVTQLLKDYQVRRFLVCFARAWDPNVSQDVAVVNKELDKMGHNIGVRIVDEFLAKSGVEACRDFRDTAEVIAKVAFRMFLGVSADVTNYDDENKSFSIVFRGNPLSTFVELPASCAGLQYSNILCGCIRGALQMVNLVVDCQYARSELTGADASEIRVTLKEVLKDVYRDEED